MFSLEHAAHPYTFSWAVEDGPSYNSYGQQQSSDGKVVSGSYRVALPDGRMQIVTYTAGDYTGYVADVKHEGVAKYPEYSAPAYKAAAYSAPAYKAAAYSAPAYSAPAAYEAPVYPAPAAYEAPVYPAPTAYEAPATTYAPEY